MIYMFFYEGYSCPVCGQNFLQTDDIVGCPQCGAPHHRDCWKQEGHCYFEADHGTEKQWKRVEHAAPQNADHTASPYDSPPSNAPFNGSFTPPPVGTGYPNNNPYSPPASSNGKVCTRCGNNNPQFAEFCSRCGQALPSDEWSHQNNGSGQPYYTPPANNGYGQPPHPGSYGEYTPFHMPTMDPFGGVPKDETIDDIVVEDLAGFVGSNSVYYLPRFYKMSKGGSKFNWNWAAFFFTPYWLLYRKNFMSGSLALLFFAVKSFIANYVMYQFIFPNLTDTSTNLAMFQSIQGALDNGSIIRYAWIIVLAELAEIMVRVLFGLSANYFYMRTATARIKKLSKTESLNYRQEMIQSGGTSFMLAAVAYAILQFTTIIISSFYI